MASTYDSWYVSCEHKTGTPYWYQAHWDPQTQWTVSWCPSSLDPSTRGYPYGSSQINHYHMFQFSQVTCQACWEKIAESEWNVKMIEKIQRREEGMRYSPWCQPSCSLLANRESHQSCESYCPHWEKHHLQIVSQNNGINQIQFPWQE